MPENSQTQPIIISSQIIYDKNIGKMVFYGVLFGVIIIEFIIAALLIPGKITEISGNQDKIDQLSEENQKLSKTLAAVEAIDVNQLNADLKLAESALPSEKKVAGLVTGITDLGKANNVEVTQLEFIPGKISTRSATLTPGTSGINEIKDIELQKGVRGIPMYLTVTGNEPQLLSFVRALETVSPLLGIQNLDYSVTDTASSALIDLYIYFVPPKIDRSNWSAINNLTAQERSSLAKIGSNQIISP